MDASVQITFKADSANASAPRRFGAATSSLYAASGNTSSGCAFYLFIRVMEITDILSQNVPLEDVQYLAGHSNPSGHTDL